MRQYLERIYGRSNNEFKALLKNDLTEKNKRFVITANPEILVMAEKDSVISKMLIDENTCLVPDGIAVVKGCNMLNIPVTERIAGVEIAQYLFAELNDQKKSLYLFGARPEVLQKLKEVLQKQYPEVTLSGCCDGYVKDKNAVFDDIATKKPDVCMVALGVPVQEKLIYQNLDRFDSGIFIGVGGSFDVLSGTKKRAPEFFLKHNMEWLYRIMKEPKRLKRFYDNNVKFILEIKKLSKK